jgi:hypothetical protein
MRTALLALCVAVLTSACEREECDAEAIPIAGHYVLRTGSMEHALESAEMNVENDQMVVSYVTADGARWRATYRIKQRGKTAE